MKDLAFIPTPAHLPTARQNAANFKIRTGQAQIQRFQAEIHQGVEGVASAIPDIGIAVAGRFAAISVYSPYESSAGVDSDRPGPAPGHAGVLARPQAPFSSPHPQPRTGPGFLDVTSRIMMNGLAYRC